MQTSAALDPVPTQGYQQCGAPLPLEEIARTAELVCAHCGFTSSISSDIREQASSYVAKTRWLWAQTFEARGRALIADESRTAGLPLFCFLVSVVLLLFFFISMNEDNAAPVATSASLLLGFVSLNVVMGVLLGRLPVFPSVSLTLASGVGGCLNCGAPVQFDEGSAAASCEHCGFGCIANDDIKREMKRSAARRLDVELSEADLALRDAYARTDRLAWSVLFLSVTGAIGGILGAVFIGKRFPATEPRGWLLPACFLSIAGLIGWAILGIRRRAGEEKEHARFLASLRG